MYVSRAKLPSSVARSYFRTAFSCCLIKECFIITANETLITIKYDTFLAQNLHLSSILTCFSFVSSLLLNTIISAFKPSDVSIRALEILEMIELGGEAEFPRHLLLRKLGSYVSACPPLAEHQKQVLQKVWRQISSMGNSEQYIMCAEAWIQFTVQYFGVCFLIWLVFR